MRISAWCLSYGATETIKAVLLMHSDVLRIRRSIELSAGSTMMLSIALKATSDSAPDFTGCRHQWEA